MNSTNLIAVDSLRSMFFFPRCFCTCFLAEARFRDTQLQRAAFISDKRCRKSDNQHQGKQYLFESSNLGRVVLKMLGVRSCNRDVLNRMVLIFLSGGNIQVREKLEETTFFLHE